MGTRVTGDSPGSWDVASQDILLAVHRSEPFTTVAAPGPELHEVAAGLRAVLGDINTGQLACWSATRHRTEGAALLLTPWAPTRHGSNDASACRRELAGDGRRSCGTLLADLDVHPRVAMQILRHAQFALTMEIYTVVSSDATREALKRLGERLGGTEPSSTDETDSTS